MATSTLLSASTLLLLLLFVYDTQESRAGEKCKRGYCVPMKMCKSPTDDDCGRGRVCCNKENGNPLGTRQENGNPSGTRQGKEYKIKEKTKIKKKQGVYYDCDFYRCYTTPKPNKKCKKCLKKGGLCQSNAQSALNTCTTKEITIRGMDSCCKCCKYDCKTSKSCNIKGGTCRTICKKNEKTNKKIECEGEACKCCVPKVPRQTTTSTTTTATTKTTTPAELTIVPGEECIRECTTNDVRACHFHFEVHLYQTLSRACYDCPNNANDCERPHCVPGDGIQRLITVVNRSMPGPLIQVCAGDRIVVDVQNNLPSSDLTMHWHGQTLRAANGTQGTPHMDGVPGLTQCPLIPGQLFRYHLTATEVGTHWWHAHTGFQRGDGVYGGLIVREPMDPHINLYDYDLTEHLILVQDWLHSTTESKYTLRHYGGADDFPESMIVNGRGPHQSPVATELSSKIPYQRFKVEKGKRYRFRLVNAAVLNCPITFDIDDHSFTIITSDGNPIVPKDASSLVLYPGERWDIVLSCNATNGTHFWMKFMGGVDCAESSAHQFAWLDYTDLLATVDQSDAVILDEMKPKPNFTRDIPPGVQVNTINRACYDDKICAANLRSLNPLPEDLTSEADHTFYLAFEMMRVDNKHFYSKEYYSFPAMHEDQQIPTPQINNISLKLPVSPLLTSLHDDDIPHCNAESPPNASTCHENHCECLHMYQLPLGAIVDLVFIDEGQFGDENHVIHVHGYHFWVLAQDRPQDIEDAEIKRQTVIDMDAKGEIKRNLVNPVLKDSVTVPDGGYTVIRFKTFNPGYWLLHCHLLFHSVGGMSLVLKVGEQQDIPKPQPDFPTC